MLKFAIAAFAILEIALLLALGRYATWPLVLAEVLGTFVLGIGVICCLPARWRKAVALDLNRDAYLAVSSPEAAESIRNDAAKGYLLILAGVLLIIPGVMTDAAGLGILLWLLIGAVWRRSRR